MNRKDYLSCFDLTIERLFCHRKWAVDFFQLHPRLRVNAIEAANRGFYDLKVTPEAAAEEWFGVAILSTLADDARLYRRKSRFYKAQKTLFPA